MKYCTRCGKELADDFQFCNGCGAPVTPDTTQPNNNTSSYNSSYNNNYTYSEPVTISDDYLIAQEKECLDTVHRFLRFERVAWKVGAIVFLALSCLFAFLGTIFLIVAADSYGYEEEFYLSMGLTYFFMGVLYVPISIVGFKMIGKVDEYINMLYYNAEPVINRCTSVGMIVLGAFFNTIAMIFIIINFARAKSNMPILQRAIDRQRNFRR